MPSGRLSGLAACEASTGGKAFPVREWPFTCFVKGSNEGGGRLVEPVLAALAIVTGAVRRNLPQWGR